MNDIMHRGYAFGDSTDWTATFRDAARYDVPPSWLRSDIETSASLFDFCELFRGTSVWPKLVDAALTLVETGTARERQCVSLLHWEEAANGLERLLRLITAEPAKLGELGGVEYALWRLLHAHPQEPRLLALLQGLLKVEPENKLVIQMAKKFLPDR